MNRQTFLAYLSEPAKLYQMSLVELQGLVLEYPYSANLRLLLLLKARLEDHPRQEEMLAQLASRTFDREYLYDFMRELDREERQKTALEETLELPELDKLEFAFAEKEAIPAEMPLRKLAEPEFDLATSLVQNEDFELEEEVDIPEAITPEPALEIELTVPPAVQPISPPLDTTELMAAASVISEITKDFRTPETPAVTEVPVETPPDPPPKVAPDIKDRLRRHRKQQLKRLRHQKRDRIKEIARSSVSSKEETASETLAKLLAFQGQYAQAIKMYERLSLLNPEKSTKFAGLIKELKEKL